MGVNRRSFIGAIGAGTLGAATAPGLAATRLRWGFVGTGSIANAMAGRVGASEHGVLEAISSRRMASATAFAERHGVPLTFDDWQEMLRHPAVDAVYVATPTSVREEICVAAARAGKHVLGEKPFASLPSLERITAACRESGVVFMDGTHFVHHPRTRVIRTLPDTGWTWSVSSAFQFSLPDRSNIRFDPELEPYGAVGDAGWYNMRAAVEFLSDDATPIRAESAVRIDKETGAAISGSGLLVFDDGSTSTWDCGFDSGAVIMDLRISAEKACVNVDDFLGHKPDFSADYLLRRGGWGPGAIRETRTVEADRAAATQMFDDVAALVGDRAGIEASMRASERTQALLDMAWRAGVA